MKRIGAILVALTLMAMLPMGGALAQQPAATPSASQAVLIGSDSLVGSEVRDTEGRDIGKVSRLMIDPNDGRISSLVIAAGGTLGMGSNTIAVPWGAVKVGQDRGKLIVTASRTLDAAPSNRPTETPAPATTQAAPPGATQPAPPSPTPR
jgi:sporulation protein YlmC with PRC-barrel domain